MKSPLSFTYQDIVREAEFELARMEKDFPALVQQQRMPDTIARRKIEMKRTLVKMLKKQGKYRQLTLGECFEQIIK